MSSSPRPRGLVVHIPAPVDESLSDVLALARLAPSFTIERIDEKKTAVAIFSDFPRSLDLAVRLVGEVVTIPGARASIDARPVVSLIRFWTALLCYAESLAESDPHMHCLRVSGRLSGESGCPNNSCVSHCQFICTRCFGVVREKDAAPVGGQLRDIARQAEVEWCPNLQLPNG